jgi:hypothetical protein
MDLEQERFPDRLLMAIVVSAGDLAVSTSQRVQGSGVFHQATNESRERVGIARGDQTLG